jgi:hypothetical protein
MSSRPIGYLTLRVPISLVEESESPEIPEVYTYLDAGPAELVSHDIPTSFHAHLHDDLVEVLGLAVGDWGPKKLAETTLLHEHPMPAERTLPSLELLSFGKAK